MRKAVFPGSFDPFTVGHKDIADRALRMFDHVVIGIGYNIHKASADSIAERAARIAALYADEPRISVEAYTGLTVDFARRHGAAFIVRGLREVKDFEYERTSPTPTPPSQTSRPFSSRPVRNWDSYRAVWSGNSPPTATMRRDSSLQADRIKPLWLESVIMYKTNTP